MTVFLGYFLLSIFVGYLVYLLNEWFFKKELEIIETNYLNIIANNYGYERLENESNDEFRIRITRDLIKNKPKH